MVVFVFEGGGEGGGEGGEGRGYFFFVEGLWFI